MASIRIIILSMYSFSDSNIFLRFWCSSFLKWVTRMFLLCNLMQAVPNLYSWPFCLDKLCNLCLCIPYWGKGPTCVTDFWYFFQIFLLLFIFKPVSSQTFCISLLSLPPGVASTNITLSYPPLKYNTLIHLNQNSILKMNGLIAKSLEIGVDYYLILFRSYRS